MNLIPVIMSGGSGSRLWPQSRSLYPKQFLPLVNDQTMLMLQNTLSRLDGLGSVSDPLVLPMKSTASW
ncbi:sugar phosphate nucleotidyltransferase [Endozoicomonas sp. YOMI1]|uniref:sugar phosphate nucleotidyltransferase n=1 Tax=Endozoicomonas sp. YOMI1 TaxID=2828739 RepID=UPI00214825E1|nr:sugar phosphate nucleotidyltransferase [Endozoicomonas sp. YOMI1]